MIIRQTYLKEEEGLHSMSFKRNAKDGLFHSNCKCKPDRFAQGDDDYSEVVFMHQPYNGSLSTEYVTKTYNQIGGRLDNKTLNKIK